MQKLQQPNQLNHSHNLSLSPKEDSAGEVFKEVHAITSTKTQLWSE